MTAAIDHGKLADEFITVLREWLADKPERLAALESGANPDDLCDANMAMDEAFKRCGRELPVDVSEFTDDDFAAWTGAYTIAKSRNFKRSDHD